MRNHQHQLVAPYFYQGTLNKELFSFYLSFVIPKLPRGSTIILDNLPAHKRLDIGELLLQHQCTLKYLPPYSPELNPIEKLWATVKQYLNKHFQEPSHNFIELLKHAISAYSSPHYIGSI